MSRTEAELSLSPASDCNSNTVDTSYASNTSDLEFIQDNSDYQWCTDYGYREVGVTHRSVLSSCYDELARDLDSQLAQVDMEDYSAQEILSTLPAICCPVSQPTDLSLQGERQGEMFASVSGSLMVKFDFDSSISPHTSSQDEESSMSLCQSELLFSPVKEQQLPTYSVDSLDEGDQLIVTCQANKTNYTIAFHASTVLGEGDVEQEGGGSVYTENGESMISSVDEREESKMAASDAPTTTWSKLRRGSRVGRARSKTISLPDLGQDQRPQLSNPPPPSIISSVKSCLGGCVKLFDIQKSGSGSSYGELLGDVSPSPPPARQASAPTSNFSLLRMFIAQRANSADHYMDNRWPDGKKGGELSACLEDSLLREQHELGVGVEESSSSVERLSSKSPSICTCSFSASSNNRFNVNNNNSIEREGEREEKRSTATTSAGSGVSELSAPTSSGPTPQTRLCPLHLVDRAIQTSVREAKEPGAQNQPLRVTPSQEKTGDDKKPVYVLYPNYTLPDLGFLRGGPPAERILLAPVKYSPRSPGTPPSLVGTSTPPHRPLTRKDLDYLRQKGVDHVMDWSSLAPLLPSEYWSLLCELPQVRQHAGSRLDKPAFAISTNSSKDISTPPPNFGGKTTSNSSECSSGTAPSSGYRGSSTILSEVESGGVGPANTPANPLYVYNYMEEGSSKKAHDRKRYSMFEFGGLEENLENDPKGKRRSYPAQMHKEKEEEEERCDGERWEDWWRDSAKRPHSPPSAHAHRLDQLLELSGGGELSWHWQPHDVKQLRDQVSKFLSEAGRRGVSFAEKGSRQLTPPNSPVYQKAYHVKEEDYCEVKQYPEEVCRSRYDFTHKKRLVERVLGGVEKVMSAVETMERAGVDLTGAAQAEELARTVLDSLCPPIYSLLSDGLRPRLDTAFGPISNSVWQLVEASAHQGPMTKALHELVMKLNSEDILSEGLIKFNAFIFGLLNVHGTDAWVSYLRTRESILSKHYTEESVLLSASRGHAKARALTDSLIAGLRPLAALSFRLDLLFETRLLHQSLLQLAKLPLSPSSTYDVTSDSQLLKKIVQSIRSGLSGGNTSTEEISEVSLAGGRGGRPRSCVDPGTVQTQDIAATQRKRWSTVHVGSRLVNAYDRLNLTSPTSQDINKISDSGSKSSGSDNSPELEEDGQKTGGKFRSLQRKWELLSGKSQDKSRLPRSRIPRPVTSPVRPVTMRAPTPASLQRRALSSIPTHRSRSKDGIEAEKTPAGRRPKTSTGGRPPAPGQKKTPAKSNIPRTVTTLTHRLPSDSGHLAFNEGERLRLVLEVDDSWLLCCRGDAKGLVPRSAVI